MSVSHITVSWKSLKAVLGRREAKKLVFTNDEGKNVFHRCSLTVPKTSPEIASVRCWEEEETSEIPETKSEESERQSSKEEAI